MSAELEEIVTLARRLIAQRALVEDLENALSAQKELLRQTEQEDLPQAMKEAQLSEFTLDSGERITIKDDFAIQLSNDMKPKAWDWLERNGYGAMIKTKVVVEFGKEELPAAQKLLAEMTKRKLNCGLTRDVHFQTLKAFINERTRTRKEDKTVKPVPLDLFGAVPVYAVKVNAAKT